MNAQARTRVGIIGAGNIATIAQLPTLVKRDDVELAATGRSLRMGADHERRQPRSYVTVVPTRPSKRPRASPTIPIPRRTGGGGSIQLSGRHSAGPVKVQ